MADRVNKFFAHLPQRKRNHSLFQSNHHSNQFQKYFPTVVHIPKTFQKQVKINFGINELSIMSSMTFAKALREEKHLNRARWSAVADENSSRSKSRKTTAVPRQPRPYISSGRFTRRDLPQHFAPHLLRRSYFCFHCCGDGHTQSHHLLSKDGSRNSKNSSGASDFFLPSSCRSLFFFTVTYYPY